MIVKKRALIAAMLAALNSAPTLAISLGDARVRSYLGQPLLVQIALPGATYADASALRASIGEPEDFERLSIEYDHSVHALNVQPTERDGNWIIEIRSDAPFKQPILQFPLNVDSGENRLMRAYTLLLDPPNYSLHPASTQSAKSSPDEPARSSAATENITYSPYTYQIGDGETLWPIAAEFKPLNTSTPRMMRAILAANPEAFINGDIDRLRAGSVLRIPNVAWGDVRAYERPEGGTPTFTRQEETQQEAAKPVSETRTDEIPPQTISDITLTEPEADQPRMAVVGNDTLQNTSPAEYLEQQVYLTHEEFEKNLLEQQEIRKQLDQLSEELAQLQRLMALKDQQIEALQAVVASQQKALQLAEPIAVEPDPAATDSLPAAPTPDVTPQVAVALSEPMSVPDKPQTRADYPWWIAVLLIIALPLLGWLIWARRNQAEEKNAVLAELPEISNAPPAPYTEAVSEHVQKKRGVSDTAEQEPSLGQDPREEAGGDARKDREGVSQIDESIMELNSAFPELDDFQASPSATKDLDTDVEDEPISDDELAELAEQLNRELESDYPESIPGNIAEDLVDDNLNPIPGTGEVPAEDLPTLDLEEDEQYDKIDESLDLARAYLVVGDNAAAIAILEQAMESATEPEKRRQIEELMAEAG